MKKLITISTLFIIPIIITITTVANDKPPIDRIIVFGDSLSDQGKMHEKSFNLIPVSPPYWQGRFSNGPIWTDIIANTIPIINESEAGATIVDYSQISNDLKYSVISSLSNEIHEFLNKHQFKSTDLVILSGGGNDYISYNWIQTEDLERVLRTMIIKIAELNNYGAKNILLINLPDLGKTPLSIKAGIKNKMTQVTNAHNKNLATLVTNIQERSYQVKLYDLNTVIAPYLEHPESYGFRSIDQQCFNGSSWGLVPWDLAYSLPTPNLTPFQNRLLENPMLRSAANTHIYKNFCFSIPECENYIYMDNVHPTKHIHKIMANGLLNFIKQNYNTKYAP